MPLYSYDNGTNDDSHFAHNFSITAHLSELQILSKPFHWVVDAYNMITQESLFGCLDHDSPNV